MWLAVGNVGVLSLLQVDLVVNYDFPLSSTDYLHRCGRTGRLGKRCGPHFRYQCKCAACLRSFLGHRGRVVSLIGNREREQAHLIEVVPAGMFADWGKCYHADRIRPWLDFHLSSFGGADGRQSTATDSRALPSQQPTHAEACQSFASTRLTRPLGTALCWDG
jgi:superfamily II DNA/RNA helicase